MIRLKEEMLLLREACFAVEKGYENGEEFQFAKSELYKKYNDPNIHPLCQMNIGKTLEYTSAMPDCE